MKRFSAAVPLFRLPTLMCLALLAAGAAVVPTPVRAQFTPLPRATFRETLSRLPGDTAPSGDLYRPGSDSYSASLIEGQHTAAVSGFVQTQGQPGGLVLNMFGMAFNEGLTPPEDNTPGEGISALAEVEYYFRVRTAPTISTRIPILLPVNFSLLAGGEGYGTASARWEVDVRREGLRSVAFGSSNVSVGAGTGFNRVNDDVGRKTLSFSAFNASFNTGAYSGDYYSVRMLLRGNASWDGLTAAAAGFPGAPGTGRFSAMLDPLPMVDPTFAGADQVRFEYSDNLFSNAAADVVPEPGTLALLLLPLGITARGYLAAAAARAHRGKRQA